ncbi:hypothetical protein TrLO_g7769 [Triparma laevis f. longispina]|uniref:Sphingomyelin synthase-like domain-containing protein n=1 Tax=Triparma laevis f. longispina TaxID=1714387 RepID=A0A9W7FFR3_9STRA|nr:hypothetical protein TrLO_g7769 [Triparma laevis f. longispina]
MTAAQRMPLYDVAFDFLPTITGAWWHFTDFLIYFMLLACGSFVIMSTFMAYQNQRKRPVIAIFVLKRYFQTLIVLQWLRIFSFMFTLLPGSSVQCLYTPTEEQLTGPASNFLEGRAPAEGNSDLWAPPETLYDIMFRIDPATGCGDLMFSSHTIFATLSVMIVWDYFPFKGFKAAITFALALLVPLTLASRKHYTVDVFTSLYVVPIVYELMRLKMPDYDTTQAMEQRYGIIFQIDKEDSLKYVAVVGGHSFRINEDQLPADFKEGGDDFTLPSGSAHGDYKGNFKEHYIHLRKESPPRSPKRGDLGGVSTQSIIPQVLPEASV